MISHVAVHGAPGCVEWMQHVCCLYLGKKQHLSDSCSTLFLTHKHIHKKVQKTKIAQMHLGAAIFQWKHWQTFAWQIVNNVICINSTFLTNRLFVARNVIIMLTKGNRTMYFLFIHIETDSVFQVIVTCNRRQESQTASNRQNLQDGRWNTFKNKDKEVKLRVWVLYESYAASQPLPYLLAVSPFSLTSRVSVSASSLFLFQFVLPYNQ